MTSTDTPLRLTECQRCAALVLSCRAEGLAWRVERYTVAPRHATVLHHYGVPVLAVHRRVCGWYAAIWHPYDCAPQRPGRHLVAPHICASAHSAGPARQRGS